MNKKVIALSFSMLLFNFNFAEEDYDNDIGTYEYMLESPDNHEQTPPLKDFFWTGSGDGPPPPPDSPELTPSKPETGKVKVTTVLATVYLDSYPPQAVTDQTSGDCITNCGDAGVPDSLDPEIPDDRRYWLLTVIQGSTPDSLQLKLARLYQKAFLRQQERHLGIVKSLDAPVARKKHDVHSFVVKKDNSFDQIGQNTNTPLRYSEVHSSLVTPVENFTEARSDTPTSVFKNTEEAVDSSINMKYDATAMPSAKIVISPTKVSDELSWVLVEPTDVRRKRELSNREETADRSEEMIDIPFEESGNDTVLFKREIIRPDQQPPVKVHIQNITEDRESGSVQIVYVVMVGGRLVPAAVAARDMRLVRDAEVASELGATVTTKAEPAFLKAAEGLEGSTSEARLSGTEVWALAIAGSSALLVVIALFILLCMAHRRKSLKSAASLKAYRNEILREAERNQLKLVHEEKDGRLISVVSPSHTRPSSSLLPVCRPQSADSSSTTSSGITEIVTAARRRQKKPNALKMPQKKRVGTTDSLLQSAGLESSDSQRSDTQTPTSYLSMPSLSSFPRGNIVEPLSRILEPVSVRHLDLDTPPATPAAKPSVAVSRRRMSSQLVRLGSIDKDPGFIGPMVWDLHCQRIKEGPKAAPSSPSGSQVEVTKAPSRMRQRFNELLDDAFTLFGNSGSTDTQQASAATCVSTDKEPIAQARNDHVRLRGTDLVLDAARDRGRGRSAHERSSASSGVLEAARPRSCFPQRAWGPTQLTPQTRVPTINPAFIVSDAQLPPNDPALPVISAIKDEIQRIRENAAKNY